MIQPAAISLNAAEFETELSNIAAWWLAYGVDRDRGGMHGEVGDDNKARKGADRSANLQTRALWFFSEYARTSGSADAAAAAKALYGYIVEIVLDKDYGGAFWAVAENGAIASARKQTYAQAFAIYALSAYARMSGSSEATSRALTLATLLENRAWDETHGGYVEAFARDWSLIEDVRLSERDLNAPKTMNTHLHVLEAYTALHRLINDGATQKLLAKNIRLFDDRFVAPRGGKHLALFYSMDWRDQCADESYGHDIEASWLLYEAAETLGDETVLQQAGARAVSLADAALDTLDDQGGLIYECHAGKAPDVTRHWWPQAEAMVGFYNAYQLSGDARFERAAARLWAFIKEHHIDAQRGEWFWHAAADVAAANPYKAGFWKGPYHNGRAMMEMIRRLDGIHHD